MDCITAVAGSICRLMGVEKPAMADGILRTLTNDAAAKDIKRVDRCLVYAPDAIGKHFYNRYSDVFKQLLINSPLQVELKSVFPPKTPVCFASMFTGALPECHGIREYKKPVLECDTLFDALVRSGKKVAIVSVTDSSIDRIFRNRRIDYYSETYDEQVTKRAIELIRADKHDLIVAYHQEYDDCLHRGTPESNEAINAAKNHVNSFLELTSHVESAWRRYNRLICFTPDHGAHVDPETGKGTHGRDIADDMEVYHFYKILRGSE